MEAASDTGAEFDENASGESESHKVVVSNRSRVEKPTAQPTAAVKTKTNLQPDTDEKELRQAAAEHDVTSDKAAVDMLAKEAADKKVLGPAHDEAAQKHVQDVVDAKTYFVPIGQITKRRHTAVLLVGITFLLVAAAIVYFAILA